MRTLKKNVAKICLILMMLMVTASVHVNSVYAKAPYQDGEYEVELTLVGGTGRASVTTPAKVTVQSGKATVTIVWSSRNYDYMIVDGEKYEPINSEGNSAFCVPIDLTQNVMTIIADTTAMSTPHEIEYELQYKLVKSDDSKKNVTIIILIAGAICGAVCGFLGAKMSIEKMRKNADVSNDDKE